MKWIVMSILAVGNMAFAEIPQEHLTMLVEEAQAFKTDCLESAKVKNVKEMNVSNKTADSMDKTKLSDLLNKNLGLAVSAKSKHTLNAVIGSSSSEKDKMRETKYNLSLSLKSGDKEICKNAYSIETKETVK